MGTTDVIGTEATYWLWCKIVWLDTGMQSKDKSLRERPKVSSARDSNRNDTVDSLTCRCQRQEHSPARRDQHLVDLLESTDCSRSPYLELRFLAKG